MTERNWDLLPTKIMIVGELAYSGLTMTAVNLANRPTLRGVPMPLIRGAVEALMNDGRIEYAGPGYAGSDTYRFKKGQ